MNKIQLNCKLTGDEAKIPKAPFDKDVTVDLTAASLEYDKEHDYYIYDTGLQVSTKEPVAILLFPRMNLCETQYQLVNSVGVLGPNSRSSIKLIFRHRDSLDNRIWNSVIRYYSERSWFKRLTMNMNKMYNEIKEAFEYNPIQYAPYQVGEAIGQLLIVPANKPEFRKVARLADSDRGEVCMLTGNFRNEGETIKRTYKRKSTLITD